MVHTRHTQRLPSRHAAASQPHNLHFTEPFNPEDPMPQSFSSSSQMRSCLAAEPMGDYESSVSAYPESFQPGAEPRWPANASKAANRMLAHALAAASYTPGHSSPEQTELQPYLSLINESLSDGRQAQPTVPLNSAPDSKKQLRWADEVSEADEEEFVTQPAPLSKYRLSGTGNGSQPKAASSSAVASANTNAVRAGKSAPLSSAKIMMQQVDDQHSFKPDTHTPALLPASKALPAAVFMQNVSLNSLPTGKNRQQVQAGAVHGGNSAPTPSANTISHVNGVPAASNDEGQFVFHPYKKAALRAAISTLWPHEANIEAAFSRALAHMLVNTNSHATNRAHSLRVSTLTRTLAHLIQRWSAKHNVSAPDVDTLVSSLRPEAFIIKPVPGSNCDRAISLNFATMLDSSYVKQLAASQQPAQARQHNLQQTPESKRNSHPAPAVQQDCSGPIDVYTNNKTQIFVAHQSGMTQAATTAILGTAPSLSSNGRNLGSTGGKPPSVTAPKPSAPVPLDIALPAPRMPVYSGDVPATQLPAMTVMQLIDQLLARGRLESYQLRAIAARKLAKMHDGPYGPFTMPKAELDQMLLTEGAELWERCMAKGDIQFHQLLRNKYFHIYDAKHGSHEVCVVKLLVDRLAADAEAAQATDEASYSTKQIAGGTGFSVRQSKSADAQQCHGYGMSTRFDGSRVLRGPASTACREPQQRLNVGSGKGSTMNDGSTMQYAGGTGNATHSAVAGTGSYHSKQATIQQPAYISNSPANLSTHSKLVAANPQTQATAPTTFKGAIPPASSTTSATSSQPYIQVSAPVSSAQPFFTQYILQPTDIAATADGAQLTPKYPLTAIVPPSMPPIQPPYVGTPAVPAPLEPSPTKIKEAWPPRTPAANCVYEHQVPINSFATIQQLEHTKTTFSREVIDAFRSAQEQFIHMVAILTPGASGATSAQSDLLPTITGVQHSFMQFSGIFLKQVESLASSSTTIPSGTVHAHDQARQQLMQLCSRLISHNINSGGDIPLDIMGAVATAQLQFMHLSNAIQAHMV